MEKKWFPHISESNRQFNLKKGNSKSKCHDHTWSRIYASWRTCLRPISRSITRKFRHLRCFAINSYLFEDDLWLASRKIEKNTWGNEDHGYVRLIFLSILDHTLLYSVYDNQLNNRFWTLNKRVSKYWLFPFVYLVLIFLCMSHIPVTFCYSLLY